MNTEDKNIIDDIPSRIKYYLLAWKEKTPEEFNKMFDHDLRLHEMTGEDINLLFDIAFNFDKNNYLSKIRNGENGN